MIKIYTYEDAFSYIGTHITDKVKYIIKELNEQGYSEKGIAYGIARGRDKIVKFKGDNRFWAILKNEIYKYATQNKGYKYPCKYFN